MLMLKLSELLFLFKVIVQHILKVLELKENLKILIDVLVIEILLQIFVKY